MEDKVRKHIFFYGRVQGVGFRYYSVNKARQLGLTGWVRNLYDGSVEMEVQGPERFIDELIIFLQNRRFVEIDDIKAKTVPIQDEYDFDEK
ncbi:acylphosphatase [uncultured Eubacterium sp.]|jgi:acylphosphatase|uniref:acylphosphatase n=1 Tax=uncultured Eubacterium sp. TaxID=165185 RepID=UPI0015B06208|nr:acylphosphatase [uncultured Eubacterium sp.]MBS5653362.1 acylphosphatase [Eubacterium sp.]